MAESFWDEETDLEELPPSLNEDLILISKNIAEIELEVEQAKEQLDYLEILRARQHQILYKLQDEYIKNFDVTQYPDHDKIQKHIGKTFIEVSSIKEQQILKIKLDFLLPIYPKTKNTKFAYFTALEEIYKSRLIMELSLKRNFLPDFSNSDKVFVLIVQYFNNNTISDLDNRFHSFIFNALRSARITPDDRWQKLSYMEDGRHTKETPCTEIYVGEYKNMFEIIIASKK